MKNLLLIVLLLSQFAYAQKQEIEFGEISQDEIEMKRFEKDKEAKAVVLFDKGLPFPFTLMGTDKLKRLSPLRR